ncbi:MAG: hypothetical protein JNK82_34705 [Myxococcaceae bacterium]|nr:hypothetical protein [Myxococcaceae bacterium]
MLSLVLAATVGCLPAGASLDRGVHQRLTTPAGPIHLWCPAKGAPLETVVFVHGHELDADAVYAKHSLGEQFESSGRAALFVVPEAPVNGGEAVKWGSLEALLDAVEEGSGVQAPRSVIVLGHSGAYRTIARWLGSPLATRVVLLDAAYGDLVEYHDWLLRPEVRLHVLSALTEPRATAFIAGLGSAQRARVKHEVTDLGHWELVSGEATIARVIAEQPTVSGPATRAAAAASRAHVAGRRAAR